MNRSNAVITPGINTKAHFQGELFSGTSGASAWILDPTRIAIIRNVVPMLPPVRIRAIVKNPFAPKNKKMMPIMKGIIVTTEPTSINMKIGWKRVRHGITTPCPQYRQLADDIVPRNRFLFEEIAFGCLQLGHSFTP